MPIWKFGAYAIQIRGLEHGKPHVHVITPDHQASVSIEDGSILAGALPSKIESQAKQWISENHDELLRIWDEWQTRR
jgi:hypothetical protein